MVISHRYRYVYVQTMKTASTAMAAELCELYDGEMILHKHATITEFRAQASDEERAYFSFAGVRNPLDVAVSRYELRKTARNAHRVLQEQTDFILQHDADLNAFLREFLVGRYPGYYDIGLVPQDWHSRDFQSIDHIYRYENLQEEFAAILGKLGIEQQRPLPVFNATETKRDYLDYYDDWTLRLACVVFQNYMRRWGYPLPDRITGDQPAG